MPDSAMGAEEVDCKNGGVGAALDVEFVASSSRGLVARAVKVLAKVQIRSIVTYTC